ncbi:transporter [Ganoderma sinense ZZ0214-1]|uniref:non-specific serine/threonine protein kinase n=1 Tax=Ganoderma sinense ZZ0214-1 TaxID=1077348 RepID=A0A2G8RZY2_9APHY|nr:transporter [Ganoderma sinense ZZ0214-1]
MLLHEACALVLLRAWGRSQYFEYLVMERLGPNLEDTVKKIGATRLTQRNLVVLVCQILDIVEHVHEKGIVHCDIKPRNFVFGTGENAGRLHLIDFGLSRPWTDPTGNRLPEESNCGFRGTPQFASRNIHLRHTPSRRDDLESLAYTAVKLLTGTLPWADAQSDEELLSTLYAHSGHTLCQGYDALFAQFVDYAHSLQYEDTPRYQYWRSAFRELVPGLSEDASFDPDDASEPRVGTQKNCDRLRSEDWPKPTGPEHVDSDPLLESVLGGDSRSEDGGRHGFTPNLGSTWSCGEAIPAGDLFGDEFAVVAAGVEFIDAPPDYTHGSCTYPGGSPPERMKNSQSDTRCI